MSKLVAILASVCLYFGLSFAAHADNCVGGYSRSDGTFVKPHCKSDPNSTNWDNYSTRPNINPYTGREGSRARDYSSEAYNYGSGRTIQEGPRGGQYYHNDSGRKVYVPKR
jgi:hypothetical protein